MHAAVHSAALAEERANRPLQGCWFPLDLISLEEHLAAVSFTSMFRTISCSVVTPTQQPQAASQGPQTFMCRSRTVSGWARLGGRLILSVQLFACVSRLLLLLIYICTASFQLPARECSSA